MVSHGIARLCVPFPRTAVPYRRRTLTRPLGLKARHLAKMALRFASNNYAHESGSPISNKEATT